MERISDGDLEILVGGPAGFANNIYLLVDRPSGEAVFIDAPDEEACVAVAEAAGVTPRAIWLTHSHGDHTKAIDALKAKYGLRLVADPGEPWLREGQLDDPVAHGQTLRLGRHEFRVLGVPGHTPASTTFVWGRHAFVGDTLFPGGPGHSRTHENLLQEIASITTHLYALPDETVVYPGHGARTTIGESKREYAVFAAREHDPDLHGDVNWLTS